MIARKNNKDVYIISVNSESWTAGQQMYKILNVELRKANGQENAL